MTFAVRLFLTIIVAPLTVTSVFASNLFTIDQVLSAPFASSPLAAPTGATVAWLLNERGHRNVWVAAAPDWRGQRITQFNQDDGQEIAQLAWAPDSSYLLFTRGGDFEMGRENPNPALSPEKPEQEIWMARLDGASARKITGGHSPAISPKGDLALFIRENHIFTMNSSGEKITALLTAKGVEDLQWSPDGSAISFVSDRGDHSFIGLYRFATKSLTYLNPSVDQDIAATWSTDSLRIAYIRNPAVSRPFAFGPQREGQPWSIYVTEVKTGESHQVFRASTGAGSVFHEIVAPHQFLWGASNRLIFPWERNGWCHLYSVDSSGGDPVELTPGNGEVEHLAITKDASTVYYSTNIGDVDRRHLSQITLGNPVGNRALTGGEDTEVDPAPVADGSAVVYLSSSYNQAIHAVVRTRAGQIRDLAPQADSTQFPAKVLVKPEAVLITAADGMQIHGQLFTPPSGSNGERHPALIFFHGGSRRQMLLGFHYMYYYSNAYSLNQFFANHGYVVLSVNYRSGIGYGLEFREALNYGATGASEFNDVLGAGLYLKSRPDVDPKKIGVWGGSYGGYLTALALARASDLFAAGVDFHGVHDWNNVIQNFVPAYNPKTDAGAARIAFESSPLAYVHTWKSPVLLIHGDDDRNVPFSETVRLVEALRQQKVPFEQLVFPNEIHDFLLQQDWAAAYKATAQFFERRLAAKPD